MERYVLVAAALAIGCSSTTEPLPFDDGSGATSADGLEPRLPYPEAPYGTARGATVENFRFLGWQNPAVSGYDTDSFQPVSLAQFYDPSGAKGVKLLVLTSTAVWCSACKIEYQDFATGKAAAYETRGVRFLGALFEDNDGGPAQPSDLAAWAKRYQVEFPFVLDPQLKLGSFFNRNATPMAMVVDARTMEILMVEEGWATQGEASLWTYLDLQLER